MIAKSFLLLAAAALSVASPIGKRDGPDCNQPQPQPDPVNPTMPMLPMNGGGKELPQPDSSLTLKNILLGFGIQNYTCASEGASPAATGALAALYDITHLYPGRSPSSLSQGQFDGLTSYAIRAHAVPLRIINPPQPGQLTPGADVNAPFLDPAPLELPGLKPIPFVGHHFFNEQGVPQFQYNDVKFMGKKLDGVDAPAYSDRGPDNTGAVAWLQLGATEGSVGSKLVYRVRTAGGSSHGCRGAGSDSTSYTTMYWFYS